jgi:catechol 2,3-dioxygenase-like lactoylglutathione lyase family enzyme
VPVAPRVTLTTLGVRDLARSTAFYQQLGWPLSPASVPGEVSFFGTQGAILALWGHDSLAHDADLAADPPPAYRGTALAVNLESRDEVDRAFETVRAAGGTIAKPPHATDWGGYSGYFTDPDGHLWEIAHNPSWPIGPDGRPKLPT